MISRVRPKGNDADWKAIRAAILDAAVWTLMIAVFTVLIGIEVNAILSKLVQP